MCLYKGWMDVRDADVRDRCCIAAACGAPPVPRCLRSPVGLSGGARMVPTFLELGGKDAAVVCASADLQAAALV